MTSAVAYASVAVVKARLGISDTTDDTKLETMLQAVSRAIDDLCGRRFYADAADATRYYTPEFNDALFAGDMISLTTLQTDEDGDRTYERTWLATDYDLTPDNAALDGKPYTAIRVTPDGSYVFPVGVRKSVKLVGKWGWPSVPQPVAEACILLTERVFKRRDAIFGVVGSPDLGQLRAVLRLNEDPEVGFLLQPFVALGVY